MERQRRGRATTECTTYTGRPCAVAGSASGCADHQPRRRSYIQHPLLTVAVGGTCSEAATTVRCRGTTAHRYCPDKSQSVRSLDREPREGCFSPGELEKGNQMIGLILDLDSYDHLDFYTMDALIKRGGVHTHYVVPLGRQLPGPSIEGCARAGLPNRRTTRRG